MVDFSKSLFIVDVLLQLLVLYVPEMGAHEVGKGAKLEGDDLSHLLSFFGLMVRISIKVVLFSLLLDQKSINRTLIALAWSSQCPSSEHNIAAHLLSCKQ